MDTKMKYVSLVSTVALCGMLGSVAYAGPEVELSGLVEVEAFTAEDFDGGKVSDIVAATVEVGIDANLNDYVDTHVLFFFEEDESDGPLTDEATITLHVQEGTYITAGKLYVPFGRFDTNLVSDPLTLAIGETNETVVMAGYENQGFSASVYGFNGDSAESTQVDDDEFDFGLSVGYALEDTFDIALGYITNMADSDTLQEIGEGLVNDKVAGGSVSVSANFGPMMAIAEHLQALDDFVDGDFNDEVAEDLAPSATNLEIGYDAGNYVIAAGYQQTSDSLFIGLPKEVVSVGISFDILDGNAGLAFEYAQTTDYDLSEGGTAEDANQFLMQISTEF